MRTLIVLKDSELSELLKFYGESHFSVVTHCVSTHEEAIQCFEEGSGLWSLVVCDYSSSGKILIPYVLKNQIQTQFLLIVPPEKVDALNAKTREGYFFVHPGNVLEGMRRLVSKMSQSGEQDYFKAKTNWLLKKNAAQADIYAQLSNQKFAKIIRAGQELSHHDLDHLKGQKQLEDLWVHRSDLETLTQRVLESLVVSGQPQAAMQETRVEGGPNGILAPAIPVQSDLEKATRVAVELKRRAEEEIAQRIQADLQVRSVALVEAEKKKNDLQVVRSQWVVELELAQQFILKAGSQAEVQSGSGSDANQALMRGVQSFIKKIRSSSGRLELIQEYKNSKENHLVSHSLLLALLSCLLALRMDWSSDLTFQKLILSSFLHDLAPGAEEFSQFEIMSAGQRIRSGLGPSIIKAFQDHPLRAAERIREFQEMPPDVYLLISNHHEKPDGSGFPQGLTASKIVPLSALFILAHDWVDFQLVQQLEVNESIPKFVELKKNLYNAGAFRKIIQALPRVRIEY